MLRDWRWSSRRARAMLRLAMKLLTLIRHAKSSWASGPDGELRDFDRPLNARGERDAPVMGKRLAAVTPLPDLVLASPAARARRTAELITAEAGIAATLVFEKALYLASPGQMLGLAQEQNDGVGHLALVSHNPGTTDLANILADARIQNIPTCGTVRLQLEVDHWRDAAPGRARMLDFDYPKKDA